MGTKAVFMIHGYNDARGPGSMASNGEIVGMCMDGFPANLSAFAVQCFQIARKMRVMTKFQKQDRDTIKKVLAQLVENHKDWLFLDDSRAPQWVSHSAVLDIKYAKLYQYDGYMDDLVKTEIVDTSGK